MVFSSMLFLWLFLLCVLLIYYISNDKLKNTILLAFSLIFYAWGEPKYIILMLISVGANYICGILIDRYRSKSKLILIVDIILNLLLLGYFKYFNFFIDIINSLIGNTVFSFKTIALPIGISFYTFQILSYTIDLYRKEIGVQKNFLNLALYVSFFPQLIAGPIVKYKDVEKEINHRKVNVNLFVSGIKRFTYGLGKKVILANTLSFIADSIYLYDMSELNTPLVWLAAISYMLQIYFDFSGYSDMAIGLGRLFGFKFPENFDLPYISKSITEFWRRWHISLSTWFKQYLYIPLGGNRRGKFRTYINLLIVFFLTGLWHGASCNFIIWGLYYGAFLVIERMFLKNILDKNRFAILNHIYVVLIVIIGWVLFRINDLNEIINVIKMMFSFNFKNSYILTPAIINSKSILIIIFSVILCGPLYKVLDLFKNKKSIINFYENKFEIIVIVIILFISILELVSTTYNPFIYFRF